MITDLHDQDDVPPGPEDPEQLGQGGGVDLAGGEPVGAHDHVVTLVVDGDGAQAVHVGLDVVLEDALGLGLAQHAEGAVQPVNVAVTVTTNLSPEEASAGSQVKDANLGMMKVQGIAAVIVYKPDGQVRA